MLMRMPTPAMWVQDVPQRVQDDEQEADGHQQAHEQADEMFHLAHAVFELLVCAAVDPPDREPRERDRHQFQKGLEKVGEQDGGLRRDQRDRDDSRVEQGQQHPVPDGDLPGDAVRRCKGTAHEGSGIEGAHGFLACRENR